MVEGVMQLIGWFFVLFVLVLGIYFWTSKRDKNYKGEYKNGKRNGKGTFINPKSGKKYVGEWRDDKMSGQGTLYNSDGTIAYEGLWENGIPKDESKTNESSDNEIISKEEAVKKLKEAKELREIEVISEKEYDALVVKYKPLLLRDKDVIKENSETSDEHKITNEYISKRSKIECRPNEIFSKNKSLIRGENTQTIGYDKINKVEKFKWAMGKFIFFAFGMVFFGMGFSREESIGGGNIIYHHTIDEWVINNIIVSSIVAIVFVVIGIWFNSKFGKNISIYLHYYIGSKKTRKSIYTSENQDEIDTIIQKINSNL